MRSRFGSNIAILVLAGALVTLSLVLAPAVVAWLGLAIGSAVVGITALAFLSRDRGGVQRGLDAPVAILGIWTIVASRVFAGATIRWLTFGEAALIAVCAIVGLIAHEALSEQTLRSLLADPAFRDEFAVGRRRTTSTLDAGR